MNSKPLTGLSKVLRILLKIDIAVSAATVLLYIYKGYYFQLPPDVDVSETLLASAIFTVESIELVLWIVLTIVFLQWIYRTNKNLHVLSSWSMRFTPGWAIGWYFIPIANLFKPYQAMKEIWQVSHREANGNHMLLNWWWFLWIVSGVLNISGIVGFFNLNSAINDYIVSHEAYIASDSIEIVLDMFALMLVFRICTAYSQNYVEPEGALDGGSTVALHPPDMAEWYFRKNGKQIGPLNEEAIIHNISSGDVRENTYVCKQGLSDWVRIDQTELKKFFVPPPQPDSGPSLFFPTSKTKLMVMYFCTLGFYGYYWFYKNWEFLKEARGYKIQPFWRTVFTIFFCYSLFDIIHENAEQLKISSNYSPGWQTIGFILLSNFHVLDWPLNLAVFLAVIFLLPVQETINNLNEKVFVTIRINDQFVGGISSR